MPSANHHTQNGSIVVIGAGPAGLSAAYELVRHGLPVIVAEQDRLVGGLARTVEYHGFRFDIGGHRFFTKNPLVQELWQKILGTELLVRPRLSRIYYQGRFFDYPLRPMNALNGLGFAACLAILGSYLWRKLVPVRPEVSFADWVTNRFGDRLYLLFFKSYTEKVWGIPCHEIGAQWAAQRIRGLSLRTAMSSMFFPIRHSMDGKAIRTLIDEFLYPRFGPGMMWEAFRKEVENRGGDILLGCRIESIRHDQSAITAVATIRDGACREIDVSQLVSSMPLRELVRALRPLPPSDVMAAAGRLRYRDFLTVALILDAGDLFPDNWIYIHDSKVRVGRIQNFKNWSPDMVPDQTKTCLGMEYFCTAGDELWSMDDKDLVRLASRELAEIGLAQENLVSDGVVVRMPKAYPVYDEAYEEAVSVIRRYLARFTNLQVIGRNGMHKYNNMDHSMLTGALAGRNIIGESHDLWEVNADEVYHEEDSGSRGGDASGSRA